MAIKPNLYFTIAKRYGAPGDYAVFGVTTEEKNAVFPPRLYGRWAVAGTAGQLTPREERHGRFATYERADTAYKRIAAAAGPLDADVSAARRAFTAAEQARERDLRVLCEQLAETEAKFTAIDAAPELSSREEMVLDTALSVLVAYRDGYGVPALAAAIGPAAHAALPGPPDALYDPARALIVSVAALCSLLAETAPNTPRSALPALSSPDGPLNVLHFIAAIRNTLKD